MYAQVAWAQSWANQGQHTGHMSRATCRVSRGTKDTSATKFDRTETALILAPFYWLKPLTDEGEEETRVPKENPYNELQQMSHTNENPSPNRDSNPHSSIGGGRSPGKQTWLPLQGAGIARW